MTEVTRTQADQILAHLKEGRGITPLDALHLYGCFRLGARVFELKQAGFDIRSQMVDVGNGKKVSRYRLGA